LEKKDIRHHKQPGWAFDWFLEKASILYNRRVRAIYY
jgi:hypothetical protein